MKRNTSKEEKAQDILSSEDEEDEMNDKDEMNAEAQALRQAIKEGVFDNINISKSLSNSTKQDEDGENEGSDEEEEEDEKSSEIEKSKARNKALLAKTLELENEKKEFHWLESFDVITSDPLPFYKANGGNPLHVHDDLKREVSFYNVALEAVQKAKQQCHEVQIPFSRPDDFFAEMVKSDDHMAKVKDRLIFETKKMEAFEQRKSNKEQRLRSKEARSKKLAEKAKYKKDNLKAVDSWAKSAASNRIGDGKVRDGDDQQYLQKMEQSQRRKNLNKKYGFGGQKGRFKQMDQKTINDMSNYNPKGNFGGVGTKRKGGSGNKRAGKRARDSLKQKR